MISYIELLRPLNCLMALIGTFIGGFLVFGGNFESVLSMPLGLALISAFLITGAGNAINDYIDLESDKADKPKRPIPSGKVSKNSALILSTAFFIAGISIAGFINWLTFAIALINSALLVVYSHSLQNKILIGNIVIGYLVGSLFLFGGAAMGNIGLPLVLMFLAMLVTISREIVKDIEDMEGDKLGFLKRLTSKILGKVLERFKVTEEGVKPRYEREKFVCVAVICLGLAIVFSALPYSLGILHPSYLIFVVPADLIFLFSIYQLTKSKKKTEFSRVSKRLKIGMFLGLIAFILGVLV
jgi:geranylgeranylglycerol-phosphate geranylgeranyltransferase